MEQARKSINDEGVLSRARGCLFGQFAGDSLGGLVEFSRPEMIRRMYPPSGPRLLENGGHWNILAGQPTDDSEMALALARSIVLNGGFDKGKVHEAYIDWLRSRPFDMGITISNALQGCPSPRSEANGAMMRVSPLAVYGAGMDWRELWRMADEDAALTHINTACRNATSMFAILVADAVWTGDTPEALVERMLARAAEMKADSGIIRLAEDSRTAPPADYIHSMGWVRIAFGNALWHLMNTGSTEDAVCATVAKGGDTDTNAAICGALMGAAYGEESVPLQWRQSILDCRPGKENRKT
ncbi:MAG: ADP-ribosylglycohydrolase family protein, partial [Mailhella sp.]|nr:ADP-ribosylglycohydrolase family protein [Mailhella sp.]